MKTTLKFRLLIAGLMSTLAIVCAVSLWQSSTSRLGNEQAYKGETVATAALADANSELWALRWGVAQYLALTDPGQRQILVDADKKAYGAFEERMQVFFEQPLTETTRAAASEVKEKFATYAAARVRWMDLMAEGKTEDAATLRARDLTPAGAATVAAINKVIELERTTAEGNYMARNADLTNLSRALLVGCLLVVGVGTPLSYMLVRSLSRQLGGEPRDAASLASSVARGDLSVQIDVQPGDVSSLMAQLHAMQASLGKVVANVRLSSDGVAAASEQIAKGNSDLSSRTAQQTSALEQTAASMEQFGATIRQNADNALQANQLAQVASSVAVKGGAVIGQVVDTMRGINDSSRKIADIIGVIDSIAFQTNILALNAAVEAARAGEQGRGFAVVAGEVRTLAQRSAEAAREIKSLITASVDRVERGSTLVDQAGATMTEVVDAIRRVTEVVRDISSASAKQSAGVAQVGDAVGQLDRTTQQNASLVEESAAAAENLKVQAQRMVQAVAVFKLA